jgi:hypothetical protein
MIRFFCSTEVENGKTIMATPFDTFPEEQIIGATPQIRFF